MRRISAYMAYFSGSHFQNFGMLRLDVLAMGSSFTVKMVLVEALVRMVLTVLMLPLHGVSRSSSNLSREQLQHHIMCINKKTLLLHLCFHSVIFASCFGLHLCFRSMFLGLQVQNERAHTKRVELATLLNPRNKEQRTGTTSKHARSIQHYRQHSIQVYRASLLAHTGARAHHLAMVTLK